MDYYCNTNLLIHYNHHDIPDKFPKFSKPKIIGCYSVDGERNFVPTAEKLKYLKLPKLLKNLKFNLNCGYENVIHKPESAKNEKIDHILQFIINNKTKLLCDKELNFERNDQPSSSSSKPINQMLNCDFIAFRGLLRLIMCTPYENIEDWRILATRYRGNIYLCNKETDNKKFEVSNRSDDMKRILSYGFKFEQYILKDDPVESVNDNDHVGVDAPVNESEEFASVFRTDLEELKLLYVAEMDGIKSDIKLDIDSDTDLNQFEFIEVKVKRRENGLNQLRNFYRFKFKHWWCQCFLVGIQKLYVGVRNDKGIVNEIEIMDLKESIKLSQDFWSPTVCMDFLKRFLRMVKHHLSNIDCPNTVYEYYRNPKHGNAVSYRIHEGRNNLTFLPDWYINEMKLIK